jgi:hypothetical protein
VRIAREDIQRNPVGVNEDVLAFMAKLAEFGL